MFKGNIVENTEDKIIDYWDDYVTRTHLEDTESKMSKQKELQRKERSRRGLVDYHESGSDAMQLYAMANLVTSSSTKSSSSYSSSSSSDESSSSYSSSDSGSSSSSCD